MFCPKCGAESLDGQRFCKSCGTNLQLINNALRGGDGGQSIYGIDIEALKQNAIEFAKSWKEGWSGSTGQNVRVGVVSGHTTRELKKREREEAQKRNLPRPKDWLRYTWQHNLRDGLMSLFSGLGLGAVLYYLGRNLVGWGAFDGIQSLTPRQLEAIQHAVSVAWMLSVFPVVKGLAQIIYASFFAESMKTLSDRFAVQIEPEQGQITGSRQQEPAATTHPRLETPPPSVTEHTTEIFEPAPPMPGARLSDQ